ncbi:MAG: restriction endonuclease subunit S, partial [Patiriisocius sp.]
MTHNTDTTPTKIQQDAKLGVIPDGWTTPKISEVFQFINTTSFSRNQLNYDGDNELFYIHYGDIHATYKKPLLDFEIENNIPRLNSDVELPSSIQYLKDGDVIIADASEDYEGVGEAIEMKNLNGKKVISGLHTFALRDLKNKTVPGFRTYIFKNPNVKKALKTIATGSKVYGISKSNVQKFNIVLPPLPEQQKIAQILSTWDVAINKQEALIAQKQEQKKGLMQQLLTGKKRLSGFTDEWEEVRLGDISKSFSGGTPSSQNKDYYNGNIHWIKSGELNQVRICNT